MKDRLLKIITSEGLTSSLLADEIGVQRSGISHILSGRNYPSFDFLQKLLIRFPRLNAEWLILGQGPMYKASASVADLFSQPPSGQKNDAPLPSDTNQTVNEKISSPEGDKNYPSDPLPDISPSGRDKEIETIVVFYSDKTFKAYTSG